MTSHNLALKTSEEQKLVELDKQASLAIYRFKRGDITRYDIDMQIAKLDEQDRQVFKGSVEPPQEFRPFQIKTGVRLMGLFNQILNFFGLGYQRKEWLSPQYKLFAHTGFVPPSQRSKFSGVARAKRETRSQEVTE